MTKHKKIPGWAAWGGGIDREKRPLESSSGKSSQYAPEAADTTVCTRQRHLEIQQGVLECNILVQMRNGCSGKKGGGGGPVRAKRNSSQNENKKYNSSMKSLLAVSHEIHKLLFNTARTCPEVPPCPDRHYKPGLMKELLRRA